MEAKDVVYSFRTHGEMVKFENEEDEEWKKVEKVLAEMAQKILR